jgi:hypothetical protein
VALATSGDSRLTALTGQYLHHMTVREPARAAREVALQDRVLDLCEGLSGISL